MGFLASTYRTIISLALKTIALAAYSVNPVVASWSPAGYEYRVVGVIWMALWAMRSGCLTLTRIATQSIHQVRNRLQVIWVHATRYTAQVIQLQTFWKGAFNQFIHQDMGALKNSLAPTNLDTSITSSQLADPNPATGLRYRDGQSQKSFEQCKLGEGRHVIPPRIATVRAALLVRKAVAACFYFTPAEAI